MKSETRSDLERMKQGAPALNEVECWNAIEQRDIAFDGLFWYGVLTTGIYCRPSCPSRQPKRENVVFFAWPEMARKAGFRSCRRCRPDDTSLRDPEMELVRNICRLIDESIEESPNLAYLSQEVGVSQFHLQRVFKRAMGISPRTYAAIRRVDIFKAGVKAGQSVVEAMYDAGYSSSSRLYEKSSDHLGMTPATYVRGGRGALIAYTIVESQLGWLLVATTNRGVCSVALGDEPEKLVADLFNEFPQAEICRDDARLRPEMNMLLESIAGQAPHLDLPLDIQGTAFQMRVWEGLRRIPRGRTVSYRELAGLIGKPNAARAVGRACATNPVALLPPCHRVVRKNGDLGGYRWGIERKRALLEKERME